MRHALRFYLGAATLTCTLAVASDRLDELLAKLSSRRPIEESTLHPIERQRPDPRIKTALVSAFASAASKHEKQSIAVTMAHLGIYSDTAIDFLIGPAKEAIEDRTPYLAAYQTSGAEIRGQLSAAFENWRAENNKDWKSRPTTR